ncbi:MAG TPA: RICIN domain-containing protein [Desulfuromonadaceae bacterium]|nr:RICIN domain-containing protein [Desulfuromonadaceae bacterium]
MIRSILPITTILALAFASTTHATVLWSQDTLPGTGLAPDGPITWFNDPTVGQCIDCRVFDQDCSLQNSERVEFNTTSSVNPLSNGLTCYVGWRSRFNGPMATSWNGLMQLKCRCDGDQPLVLDYSNGKMTLSNHQGINGQEVATTVWQVPTPGNVWFDLVLKLHLSDDPTQGTVEVWYNGVKQTLANGSTIYHGATWGGTIQNDIHWGIYRRCSNNGTADLYVQRPRIATTFAEAAPVPLNVTLDTTGIYQLQNVASGLVLNNQGSLTNGSKVTQWSSSSTSDNLRWKFIATDSGYYEINSVKSGKDAVVQSASTTAGAGIIQWSFGSAQNDQWKPTRNSDGSYTFANRHSGLLLEDPGSSTSTSTQLDQWGANGGNNQKWNLLKQ